MDSTQLRQWLAEFDRTLDCNPHDRDRDAARCRTPAQKPSWRLCPRHQLVKGVESVTKTPHDVRSNRPILHNSALPELVAAKRAILFALLVGSSALGGCATYIPPEIS